MVKLERDGITIGLVADTHVPQAADSLPQQVYSNFEGVDYILHAGDMHVIDVLDWLGEVAPVVAARGDGDHRISHTSRDSSYRPIEMISYPGVPDDPRVKDAQLLDLEGLTIGLTHVFRNPKETPWESLDAQMARVFQRHVDIVVCGHSHVAQIMRCGDVLIVNPGSPTLPNGILDLGTIGILKIDRGVAEAEIIHLSTGKVVKETHPA